MPCGHEIEFYTSSSVEGEPCYLSLPLSLNLQNSETAWATCHPTG